MVLVDTSIWIDHFRRGNTILAQMLSVSQVTTHPLVIGELACGNMKERAKILQLLNNLPRLEQMSHDNVLAFIERHYLWGKGIGYTDAHLLASALLSEIPLWTLDKRLNTLALEIGVATAP